MGELTILTRASYVFLLFVPILAGAWTTITQHYFVGAVMPFSWVLAFLASLAVMAGQTLHQMFAPEIVKASSRQAYSSSESKRYFENPLTGELQWAEAILKEANVRPPGRGAVHGYENEATRLAREAETVALASQVFYDQVDKSFMPASVASAICYLIGLLLIGYILSVQTVSVLSAGGVV